MPSSRDDSKKRRDSYAAVGETTRAVLKRANCLVGQQIKRSDGTMARFGEAHYRVLNAVVAFTATYSLFDDAVALSQIAEFARFSPRWTAVLLTDLQALGLITYTPGRGRPAIKNLPVAARLSVVGLENPNADAASVRVYEEGKPEAASHTDFAFSSPENPNDQPEKPERFDPKRRTHHVHRVPAPEYPEESEKDTEGTNGVPSADEVESSDIGARITPFDEGAANARELTKQLQQLAARKGVP